MKRSEASSVASEAGENSPEPLVIDGVEIPANLMTSKFQQQYAAIISAARRDPINYWHDEKRTVAYKGVEMPASYSEAEREAMLDTVRERQQDPEGYWSMYLSIEEYDELIGVY